MSVLCVSYVYRGLIHVCASGCACARVSVYVSVCVSVKFWKGSKERRDLVPVLRPTGFFQCSSSSALACLWPEVMMVL